MVILETVSLCDGRNHCVFREASVIRIRIWNVVLSDCICHDMYRNC